MIAAINTKGGGAMKLVLLIAAISTIGVARALPSRAATAFVGPGKFSGQSTLHYEADPGEANDVSIQFSPSSAPAGFDIEITDSGATISAGTGCLSVTPSSVECNATSDDLIDASLGDGNDILSIPFVDSGGGRLSGGAGDDRIRGAGNFDSIERLLGGPGDDSLFGRAGSDWLEGGPGADDLSGGRSCSAGTAEVCLADIDTVSYAKRSKRVRATADGLAGDDGQRLEGDTIMPDVERIIGGDGADVLGGATTEVESIGNGFPNPIRLVGMQLRGRNGDDVLSAGRAPDLLLGGHGNDVLRGTGGRDRLRGEKGDDRLIGGNGSDRLAGDRGNDRLLSRDGHQDHVNGGSGSDQARADVGLDHLTNIEKLL
jgi:Ca2+-binding RTX toxin-like protein